MWPFDDIGSSIGSQIGQLLSDAFNAAMRAIWDAAIDVLKAAFNVADQFSMFSVSTTGGPVRVIWPLMLWISGVLAVGLFFWQLTLTSLRGGRGFLRLISGSTQYGVALIVAVGMVAAFLAAADGITNAILNYGLQSSNFTGALGHTTFGQAVDSSIKAVTLGICAVIGVIPAAIGYVIEMLFREAAIYVLVATVPVAAAGLLANSTAAWFWKTARWMLAAIAMKPVLALALVVGIAVGGGSQGITGLLAGVGVLVISLFTPFVLFKLFAFIDPNTDAGAGFRQSLSGAGVDSYGSGNPAIQAARALIGGGGDSAEDTNTGRFDDAIAESDNEMSANNIGTSGNGSAGATDDDEQPASTGKTAAANSTGGSNGGKDPNGPGGGKEPPEPPEAGGPPSPPPPPPDGGGGGGGGTPVGPQSTGGGGGAASAGTAEEVAAVAAV